MSPFSYCVDNAVVNRFLLFQEWAGHKAAPGQGKWANRLSQIAFRRNVVRQLEGIDVNDRFPSYDRTFVGENSSLTLRSSFHTQTHTHNTCPVYAPSKNGRLRYRKDRKENMTQLVCVAPECECKGFCIIEDRHCFKLWQSSVSECDSLLKYALVKGVR